MSVFVSVSLSMSVSVSASVCGGWVGVDDGGVGSWEGVGGCVEEGGGRGT